MTPSAINSWLKRINEKYKISKEDMSTHRLRHYALTHWSEMGIPLTVIQRLAGHSKGSKITEEVYIDVSMDFIKKELEKVS